MNEPKDYVGIVLIAFICTLLLIEICIATFLLGLKIEQYGNI